MVHGKRFNDELFLECWELLHEIALLSHRPDIDAITAIRLEMLHDTYQPKFMKMWAECSDDSND